MTQPFTPRAVLRRLLGLLALLLAVSLVSFALLQLAGSDAVLQRMEATGLIQSQAAVDAARAELGLDRPVWQQYLRWLGGVLRGDMGTSYLTGEPVVQTFLDRLPATLALAAAALGLTVAVSLPLGVLAAVRPGSRLDTLLCTAGFLGGSLPNFFVALLLLDVFALRLGWLPVIAGGGGAAGVVLPALTLALAMSSRYLRQVRAAVREELTRPYVLGAAARGVPFSVTLFRSVLPAAMASLLGLLALSAGSLLGGTAIVETIFLWDGVGKLAVDAIEMRDVPVLQAYVLWMALLYAVIDLVTDLAAPLLDPRLRRAGGAR